jgi:hypothetical protein
MNRLIAIGLLSLIAAASVAAGASAAPLTSTSVPWLTSPNETIYLPGCRLDATASCEDGATI